MPVPAPNDTLDDSLGKSRIFKAGEEVGYLIKTNLKYFWILTVFWLSTATKLVFGKYNLAEHLTVNAFILGYATLLGLLGLTIFKWPLLANPIIYGIIIITLYRVFENRNDKLGTGVQAFSAVILLFVQLFILLMGIGFLRIAA